VLIEPQGPSALADDAGAWIEIVEIMPMPDM
jgi:hypothetical protein